MKKYVFIGAYDKTDMLIYVSKVLTVMGKSVLLIDTTILKKSRYIVPTMVNEKQYITNYEGIDVAIGFDSFNSISKYQKEQLGEERKYDVIIIDIDRAIAYQKFEITKEDKHFFVTSFDIYNLKKGVQLLAYVKTEAVITKIYYTKHMLEEEDEYLNFLSKNYKIRWNKKDIVFFPFETADQNAIFVNQRSGKIQMKGLSNEYIDSVLFLVEDISGENMGKIKKAYKMIED